MCVVLGQWHILVCSQLSSHDPAMQHERRMEKDDVLRRVRDEEADKDDILQFADVFKCS